MNFTIAEKVLNKFRAQNFGKQLLIGVKVEPFPTGSTKFIIIF